VLARRKADVEHQVEDTVERFGRIDLMSDRKER
jgi:hypothetical protein